ncbi:RagB/SusD family nutrient uptake outer membrane protein [Flavobacterium aurantiibacter]|uniref:RagB/SusD family nutrient uptake outer membrane protein n=1 Tax=Flavobacterium aurantiibacter TaxID=2023067 RepID=A0A255ZQJ4_9FLAO|nr:RagB/SusD family nutrient uptake outer membrane protein [Flavobacterium aurantiibacter]OYQ43184.1 hypothetical protein CHX27_10640 [Flavobacterium aurantiibacter]
MKSKYLLIIAVAALLLGSCENVLDIGPRDEITDSNAITNMEDLRFAVTGVYGAIGGSRPISWSAYFTDECRRSPQNRGQGIQIHTWSINSGTNEVDDIYGGYYVTIVRANIVLERLDGVPTVTDAEVVEKTKIAAELRAIRAFCHFELLRFFAPSYTDGNALGVVIADRELFLEELPRNTVSEVFAFINEDLAAAYTTLNQISNNDDITRITPLAVQALRARVALYEKRYDDAIVLAEQVAAAVPLATTPAAYLGIWSDAQETEVIFELKRVAGDGAVGTIFQDTNREVYFNISNSLFSIFQVGDYRRNIGALQESGSTPANLKVGKYSGSSSNYGLNDIKILRASEMYLILAEAYALKANPDLDLAAEWLNRLRRARRTNPNSTTVLPDVTFNSQQVAVDLILTERRRELCFEGHRFFDLKRFGLGVDRLPADVVLNSFAEDLQAGDYRFTLPIPQEAIFVNQRLDQNPNY